MNALLIILQMTSIASAAPLSKVCLHYAEKIYPHGNHVDGLPTREWTVGQMCLNPEFAKLEAENEKLKKAAIEEVQYREMAHRYVRGGLNLIRKQSAIINQWKVDLVACEKAENSLIACANQEVDMAVQLRRMGEEHAVLDRLKADMVPRAANHPSVVSAARMLRSFKTSVEGWNKIYGATK